MEEIAERQNIKNTASIQTLDTSLLKKV